MINVPAVIYTLLLAVSAVGSRGFIPSIVLLVLLMVIRQSTKPVPAIILFLGAFFSAIQLIVFITITILVYSTTTYRDRLFGINFNRILLEGIANVYEPTRDNIGLCLQTTVPQLILLIVSIAGRNFLRTYNSTDSFMNKEVSNNSFTFSGYAGCTRYQLGETARSLPNGGRRFSYSQRSEKYTQLINRGSSSRLVSRNGMASTAVFSRTVALIEGTPLGNTQFGKHTDAEALLGSSTRAVALMGILYAIAAVVAPTFTSTFFLFMFLGVTGVIATLPRYSKARMFLLKTLAFLSLVYGPFWLFITSAVQNSVVINFVLDLFWKKPVIGSGLVSIDLSLPNTDMKVRRYLQIFFVICAFQCSKMSFNLLTNAMKELFLEGKQDDEQDKTTLLRSNLKKVPSGTNLHQASLPLKESKRNSLSDCGGELLPSTARKVRAKRRMIESMGYFYTAPPLLDIIHGMEKKKMRRSQQHSQQMSVVRRVTSDKTATQEKEQLGTPNKGKQIITVTNNTSDNDKGTQILSDTTPLDEIRNQRESNRKDKKPKAVISHGQVERTLSKPSAIITRVVDALFHYLFYVPVLPLVAIAASIIFAPSVCSIVLLPFVWAGLLLSPRAFGKTIWLAISLKAIAILIQFVDISTHDKSDRYLSKALFFADENGWRIAEMVLNVSIYIILCGTTYRNRCHHESEESGYVNNRKKDIISARYVDSIHQGPLDNTIEPPNREGLDSGGIVHVTHKYNSFSTKKENNNSRKCNSSESFLVLKRKSMVKEIGECRIDNIIASMAFKSDQTESNKYQMECDVYRPGDKDMNPEPSDIYSGIYESYDDQQLDFVNTFIAMIGRPPSKNEEKSLMSIFGNMYLNNCKLNHQSQRYGRKKVKQETNMEELVSFLNSKTPIDSNRESELMKQRDDEVNAKYFTKWIIIECFASYASKSTFSQIVQLVRFLVIQYYMPLSLFSLFVAGTFVKKLDVLHTMLLVIFLVYICSPIVARRYWFVCVAFTMSLTTVLVITSFISRLISLHDKSIGSMKYSTMGLMTFPEPYFAIPLFVASFLVAAERSFSKQQISNPHDFVIAYDWRRFASNPIALKWKRHFIMVVAVLTFLALILFKDKSLFNEGLLLLLMVILVSTSASSTGVMKKCLWMVAVIYGAVAIILSSWYQFESINGVFHEMCGFLTQSSKPDKLAICLKELGVVASEGEILCLFLAPWFIVLVVSFEHLRATIQEDKVRVPVSGQRVWDRTYASGEGDATRALISSALEVDEEAERARGLGSHDNVTTEEVDLQSKFMKLYKMFNSARDQPFGRDQKAISLLLQGLNILDILVQVIEPLVSEVSLFIIWGALYNAATREYNLLSLMYGILFVLQSTSYFTLIFCVLHISVIYTYSFVFFPKINGNLLDGDMAQVIGLVTKSTPQQAIIAPLLVFFAILLRVSLREISNSMWIEAKTTEVENIRKFIKFMKLPHIFDFIGYELVILAILINLHENYSNITGILTAISAGILIYIGRDRFLTSLLRRFIPFLCIIVVYIFSLIAMINNRHKILTPIRTSDFLTTGRWTYFFLTGLNPSHLSAFFAIALIHIANENQYISVSRLLRAKAKYNCPSAYEVTLPVVLRQRGIKRLAELDPLEFEHTLPDSGESTSTAYYSMINQFAATIFVVCAPSAITTIVVGAMHVNLLYLVIVIGGLVQLIRRREIQWDFNIVWPKIVLFYSILLIIPPLVMSAFFMSNIVRGYSTVTSVFGLSLRDESGNEYPLPFSIGFVAVIFVMCLQRRIFYEVGFEVPLRCLNREEDIMDEKRKRLTELFIKKSQQELDLCAEHEERLKKQLIIIREMSVDVNMFKSMVKGPDSSGSSYPVGDESVPSSTVEPHAAKLISPQTKCDSEPSNHESTGDRTPEFSTSVRSENEVNNIEADTKKNDNDVNKGSQRTSRIHRFVIAIHYLISSGLINANSTIRSMSFEEEEPPHLANRTIIIRLIFSSGHFIERHFDDIVLFAVIINFLVSGNIWNGFICVILLVFAAPQYPFADTGIYSVVGGLVLIGMMIKCCIYLTLSNIVSSTMISKEIAAALSFMFINIHQNQFTSQTDISSSQTFIQRTMDLVVLMLIIAHQNVCRCSVLYRISRKRLSEDNNFDNIDTTDDNDTKDEENNMSTSIKFDIPSEVKDEFCHHISLTDSCKTEEEEEGKSNRNSALFDHICEANESTNDIEEKCNDNGFDSYDKGNFVVKFIKDSFINITTRHGTGSDVYTINLVIDIISVIIFGATYYYIQGISSGSIANNVQEGMLPGTFVILIFVCLLLMITDRVLYIKRWIIGKLILLSLTIVSLLLGYVIWVNVIQPQNQIVGSYFFTFRFISVYLGCVQLRKGYAVHRRHDPFTYDPQSTFLYMGYMAYRAVPFLWEIRVCTDFACEKSSLAFSQYLNVEDMNDILFKRFVDKAAFASYQPVLGTALGLNRKLIDGASRVLIMLVVLILPLFYFSTLNPVMTDNEIRQIKASILFEGDHQLYTSSVISMEQYPGELASWLSKTRPSIANENIVDKHKLTQFSNLEKCSNNIWMASPHTQRSIIRDLRRSIDKNTSLTLTVLVEIVRSGTTANSGKIQDLQATYKMPQQSAKAMFYALTTRDGLYDVSLPRFLSPIIFNRPSVVSFFADDGNLNLDYTLRLRTEFDNFSMTNVSYWCLRSDSLFSLGNYPNSSYPEWKCLSKGIGCNTENIGEEKHDRTIPYVPVQPYFVTVSDMIPETISIVPNVGIIAVYTTFVLAIGGFLRSVTSGSVTSLGITCMYDPTPVDRLVKYIYVARSAGDMVLEQSLYFELVDLIRSPAKLLQLTKKFPRLYDRSGGDINNSTQ